LHLPDGQQFSTWSKQVANWTTGLFGYLAEKWIAGVFPRQWWSVGGPGSNTISQMNLQYFYSYFPAAGWSVGTSPNMLVNWYASKNSNKVTFPIGLNTARS